jgi:anti-sigma28 factor (negative regulator of flagellin synthesis)
MTEVQNLDNARLIYPFTAQPQPVAAPGESAGLPAAPDAVVADAVAVDADTLEVSDAGARLADLHAGSVAESAVAHADDPVRFDKVARIRAEIQNGTYDVDGKLSAVIHRVIKDVLE